MKVQLGLSFSQLSPRFLIFIMSAFWNIALPLLRGDALSISIFYVIFYFLGILSVSIIFFYVDAGYYIFQLRKRYRKMIIFLFNRCGSISTNHPCNSLINSFIAKKLMCYLLSQLQPSVMKSSALQPSALQPSVLQPCVL